MQKLISIQKNNDQYKINVKIVPGFDIKARSIQLIIDTLRSLSIIIDIIYLISSDQNKIYNVKSIIK